MARRRKVRVQNVPNTLPTIFRSYEEHLGRGKHPRPIGYVRDIQNIPLYHPEIGRHPSPHMLIEMVRVLGCTDNEMLRRMEGRLLCRYQISFPDRMIMEFDAVVTELILGDRDMRRTYRLRLHGPVSVS
jgi:hypothetical protein